MNRLEQFDEVMMYMTTPGRRWLIGSGFRQWLIDSGFFMAPASTKYHGNHEGGLFDHSKAVVDSLVSMDLQWQREDSPFIIGMFHDLCKIDAYTKVVDVEGEQMMGTDEVVGEESHFEYNKNQLLKGHGEKSIMLLSQFMTLTEEEILCIRYHMGAYETENWNEFDAAIKKYSTVLFTHTADMLASKVVGI